MKEEFRDDYYQTGWNNGYRNAWGRAIIVIVILGILLILKM